MRYRPSPDDADRHELTNRHSHGPGQRLFPEGARRTLRARGEFDPALHGTEEQAPLTVGSTWKYLPRGELLARYYRHPSRVHDAVLATATWAQVAAATGTREAAARQAYREWADRQHALWQHCEGRFGLSDAERADAVHRAAEPDPEAGQ